MHNLRIIKFYGKGGKLVVSQQGLKYLPDELRYFRWDKCPFKSFPTNFCPENLVELNLSSSNVEQLWNGEQLCTCVYICSTIIFSVFKLNNYRNLFHFDWAESCELESA